MALTNVMKKFEIESISMFISSHAQLNQLYLQLRGDFKKL